VVEQKGAEKVDDDTLILADIAGKSIKQVKETVTTLLAHHPTIEDAKAEELATLLSTGTWTHDYPIMVQQVQEMGLPVSTDMPPEVYYLMDLYAQARQKRPSVSYIPGPYSRGNGAS
jgi:ClpP class serine protease